MSNLVRRNRKGSDADIIRLNSIGLSLATIAGRISCHPTSITLRLKSLKIAAADTRRSFMEDIYNSLDPVFETDVADILTSDASTKPRSIKDYMRDLLVKDVATRKAASAEPVTQGEC